MVPRAIWGEFWAGAKPAVTQEVAVGDRDSSAARPGAQQGAGLLAGTPLPAAREPAVRSPGPTTHPGYSPEPGPGASASAAPPTPRSPAHLPSPSGFWPMGSEHGAACPAPSAPPPPCPVTLAPLCACSAAVRACAVRSGGGAGQDARVLGGGEWGGRGPRAGPGGVVRVTRGLWWPMVARPGPQTPRGGERAARMPGTPPGTHMGRLRPLGSGVLGRPLGLGRQPGSLRGRAGCQDPLRGTLGASVGRRDLDTWLRFVGGWTLGSLCGAGGGTRRLGPLGGVRTPGSLGGGVRTLGGVGDTPVFLTWGCQDTWVPWERWGEHLGPLGGCQGIWVLCGRRGDKIPGSLVGGRVLGGLGLFWWRVGGQDAWVPCGKWGGPRAPLTACCPHTRGLAE